MTLEQTRQLGIEFERRVQTMIPETEFAAKLDTETIYSYLNLYQDKLIHDLYRTVDQVPVSNNETYLETFLLGMLTYCEKNVYNLDDPRYVAIKLPEDFGLYVNSYSNVSKSYLYKKEKGDAGMVPNQLITAKDATKAILRPLDSMKILRRPLVWLTDNRCLQAAYDRYTTPVSIHVNYYKVPQHMDLMTSTPCELPMEMFEQMVTGAVDLYVQYVAGAEARRRQMAEQLRLQNKKEDEE